MGNYMNDLLSEKLGTAITEFLKGMRESGLLNKLCNYLRGHRDTKVKGFNAVEVLISYRSYKIIF